MKITLTVAVMGHKLALEHRGPGSEGRGKGRYIVAQSSSIGSYFRWQAKEPYGGVPWVKLVTTGHMCWVFFVFVFFFVTSQRQF